MANRLTLLEVFQGQQFSTVSAEGLSSSLSLYSVLMATGIHDSHVLRTMHAGLKEATKPARVVVHGACGGISILVLILPH